jgi:signal transduction histidine kinase
MVSLAAAGSAAVTLAVVAVPWLRTSFEAPSLRIALETGGSLVAVTTVALLLRQCGAGTRADHLWLSAGLLMLAATALGVATLLAGGTWAPDKIRFAIAGNLAGTALLAIAAFAPVRELRVRRRTVWLSAAALGLVLYVVAAVLAGASAGPGRTVVQIAVAAALVVAALGLVKRASQRHEPLLRWAAIAVVLAGSAKLGYTLHPRVDVQAIAPADALRVLGWVALLVGVVEELRGRIRGRADAAVARERRRLARELHDGVAQELAYIRRRAGRLADLPEGVEILSAAERALEDSRRAIDALAPPITEPLHIALERHGARLALECEVEVRVNTRCTTEVMPDVRAELLRIVAEAVRNAAHHGGARHVQVDLLGPPLRVRVMDDGHGFVTGASSGLGVAGYGLIAMRERAALVGGQLSLESVPGAGTLLQVVLP